MKTVTPAQREIIRRFLLILLAEKEAEKAKKGRVQ